MSTEKAKRCTPRTRDENLTEVEDEKSSADPCFLRISF